MYELLTTPVLDRAQWKSRVHGPPPGLSNLYFSGAWPGSQDWLTNQFFQITQTSLVKYPYGSLGLPGNDYEWLDLENANFAPASFSALNLYPNSKGYVYEILIGMKPGNYQTTLYIPGTSDYLLSLGYPPMIPSLADPNLKYLGAFRPEDSPIENPQIKIWTVYQLVSWLLQVYADVGQDYEKPSFMFYIAKHKLTPIKQPSVFDTIQYFSEFRGSW